MLSFLEKINRYVNTDEETQGRTDAGHLDTPGHAGHERRVETDRWQRTDRAGRMRTERTAGPKRTYRTEVLDGQIGRVDVYKSILLDER